MSLPFWISFLYHSLECSGAEYTRKTRPSLPSGSPQLPSVLVTDADSPEQFGLTTALLRIRNGTGVVAGVSNSSSVNALSLAKMGAELRHVPEPPPASVFNGIDFMFLIPPNDETRLKRGSELIQAAMMAKVPNALILSVVGVDAPGAPVSLLPYLQLEQKLQEQWPGSFAVVRTAFYQENLLFWATDSRQTAGKLRMPFGASRGCFSPLEMADVSAVVNALSVSDVLPSQFNRARLNLTGPVVFDGLTLAATASKTVGVPIVYEQVNRATAEQVVASTGELSDEEVGVILDILAAQTTHGATCEPSSDIVHVTGRNSTDIQQFFRANRASFLPKAWSTHREVLV